MTQSELAAAIGVTQSKISKIEAGYARPSATDIQSFTEILGFQASFFGWQDKVYGFSDQEMFHRKRQQATAKSLATIHGMLNIRRMQLARLLRSAAIEGDGFPRHDPDEYLGDVERIAQTVRAQWMVPRGPIRNLVAVIEDGGGVVIQHNFGTRHIDAVSQWVPGLPPIFFINIGFPADRMRFSLAHELGHMIMHRIPTEESEREADAFAAEFLMPMREIRPQLRDLDLPSLANLKRHWKVSMQALLKRAQDIGTITQNRARSIWIELGRLGYRRHEPIELEPEKPTLMKDLIAFHLSDLDYSREDLSNFIGELNITDLFHGPTEARFRDEKSKERPAPLIRFPTQ